MKSENALEWAQLLHTELITEEDFRNLRRQGNWSTALTLAGPIGKAQAQAFVDQKKADGWELLGVVPPATDVIVGDEAPVSREFGEQVRLAFRFLLDESTLLPGSDS